MGIERSSFGSVDGRAVDRYTLTNERGSALDVVTYGAAVTRLLLPNREGHLGDVVLGFDDLSGYLEHGAYFGATIGRFANRIAEGRFELEGRQYGLAKNQGGHHLHGGKRGWDKRVWQARPARTAEGPSLELSYTSPHGEEGYPGQVRARTVYVLHNDNCLEVRMSATADRTTLLNMAHHTYWNLAGHASGSVAGHELTMHATQYTVAPDLIPDGRVEPVAGTQFDFRRPRRVGEGLQATGGYDSNWVLDGEPNAMRPVARLHDPNTGRTMKLVSNQPGVQLYTGNGLAGTPLGKAGARYDQYAGLCLETQKFPNAPNVPGWKSSAILTPDERYEHVMTHHFSTE